MKYRTQKVLWYTGLALLLLFCTIALPLISHAGWIGPRIEVDNGFAVVIAIVLVIAYVSYARLRLSKGNIAKHDLATYTLFWKDSLFDSGDDRGLHTERSRRRLTIMGAILGISLFIAAGIALNWGEIDKAAPLPTMPGAIIMFIFICASLSVLLLSVLIVMELVLFHAPSPELYLFREGIRYCNHFITWKRVKSISIPKVPIDEHFHATTVRIITRRERILLVSVRDWAGFMRALEKLGKQALFKKI